MAYSRHHLATIALFLLIASFSTAAAQITWCVAKKDANSVALQNALDWACSQKDIDCGPIQTNGVCFQPNNLLSHASFAMNAYYQKYGRKPINCHFNGIGNITTTNPSYGSCTYLPKPPVQTSVKLTLSVPTPAKPTPLFSTSAAQITWCVAKKDANSVALQNALDWACSQKGVDCGPIQANGVCFQPDNVLSHASFAMNAYYQTYGRKPINCHFNGIGNITTTSPSYGPCMYLPKPSMQTPSKPAPSVSTPAKPTTSSPKYFWCVANVPERENHPKLQKALDLACGNKNVNCSAIQPNASPCAEPNTLYYRAAYAMNLYYQANDECNFNGMGKIIDKDPSYRFCAYPTKPRN